MTQIESLPFICPDVSVAELWSRFLALGSRASIVGLHGMGKTTLIEELVQLAGADGRSVRLLIGRRTRRSIHWEVSGAKSSDLLVVDGYDLLPAWRRFLFRSRRGLLVTSHTEVSGLPVLHHCVPNRYTLRVLLERLAPGAVNEQTQDKLLSECAGNFREVFRRLYDIASSEGETTPA